ncbi:Poly(A) polymerase [Backusella circina FSU 941]|nr:Poly(A) polymerase [Backusella circina FSU 941]
MSENSTFPGITPPLSLSESSQADKEATISLEKTLREYNMYESPERTQLRERVLETLDKMTKAFVYSVSTRDGMTEAQAERSGGKVLTYGSYRLGVHGRDSDIDTLCIFPSHVRRTDFFTTMLHLLRSDENIKDITAVQDSYVPVIKFKFSGISIDLVCARLSVSQVPDDIELTGTDFLSRLEEKCIRSINGTRVADDILHLVPNTATFRTALRCIKLWATKKAIYSNVLGFLGGVAWAILTARVCQLFPNASASTVVYKFFRIMHAWDWAKSPVKLRMDEEGPPLPHVSSWNPRYNPADKLHRMPIITPTYPHMCTTHNVSASTLRILKGEFRMAAETMNKIIVMGAPWSVLFERRQFFEMYDYYLQIVVSSDAYDHLRTWSGFIEAKLRLLLIKLEGISDIAMVHPYVHSFTRETPCFNRQDMEAALSAQPLSPMDGVEPIGTVWTKTFYFGLYIRAGPGKLYGE